MSGATICDTSSYKHLRVHVDRHAGEDDGAEDGVQATIPTPRRKKKEKKDRACPRRRHRRKKDGSSHGSADSMACPSDFEPPSSSADFHAAAGNKQHTVPTADVHDPVVHGTASELVRGRAISPPPTSPHANKVKPPQAAVNPLELSSQLHPLTAQRAGGAMASQDGRTVRTGPRSSRPGTTPSHRGSSFGDDGLKLRESMSTENQDAISSPATDDEWRALEAAERRKWQEWTTHVAEQERERRMLELRMLEEEEAKERRRRQDWARQAVAEEQRRRVADSFLASMSQTTWFTDLISSFCEKYEVVCPYSSLGCQHICLREDLPDHLKRCPFGEDKTCTQTEPESSSQYEVICPNSVLGCEHSCAREELHEHLQCCRFRGPTRGEELEERLHWKRVVIEESEEERARRVLHGKEAIRRGSLQRLLERQVYHTVTALHHEIQQFSSAYDQLRKHWRALQDAVLGRLQSYITQLWPGTTTEVYGSFATGLMDAESDLDVVVCGWRSGPQDERTPCESVALLAAHLKKAPFLEVVRILDHIRVPLIKLIARVEGFKEIRVDISVDCPQHTGIATAALVSTLAGRLPQLVPLTTVLKAYLRQRNLSDPFNGGLSSYGLVLMVAFLLMHSRRLLQTTSPVNNPTASTHDQIGSTSTDRDAQFAVASVVTPAHQTPFLGHSFVRQSAFSTPEQHTRFGARVGESILSPLTWLRSDLEATSADVDRDGGVFEPVLGQLLMEFFRMYSDDMEQQGFSLRGGGFRFPLKGKPLHPQASDPYIIECPVCPLSNVAKTCFRVHEVEKAFSDALSELLTLVVRFNEGRPVFSPRCAAAASDARDAGSILLHICGIDIHTYEAQAQALEKGARSPS